MPRAPACRIVAPKPRPVEDKGEGSAQRGPIPGSAQGDWLTPGRAGPRRARPELNQVDGACWPMTAAPVPCKRIPGSWRHHGVRRDGKCSAKKRPKPEDPHVLEGVPLARHGQRRDESGAERPCGVDRAPVDWYQHRVGEEHREPDGQGRDCSVCHRHWVHRGLQDHVHQDECAHDLTQQRAALGEALADAVATEAPGLVLRVVCVHGPQYERSDNRAGQLGREVEEALGHAQLPGQDQPEGHGAVDLPAAVGADGVGEHRDGEAKGQRYLEDPRGALLVRNAARAAAAHDDEQSHGDELREALVESRYGLVRRRGSGVAALRAVRGRRCGVAAL
mmetsp:Transcript_90755/g.236400  ORF Transcript_90755/g.236400 Transcript_90755/m.236400 type:complete len:335 (-) Transcript_90755:274-1278(-)